jgi:hypothetical protein
MMPDSDTPREKALTAAGLTVLGTMPDAGGITPELAWRRVVRGDITPTVTVTHEHELDEVNSAWLRLADEHSIRSEDGSFLISVAGLNALHLPWTHVRLAGPARLAQVLRTCKDEPEFVTAAVDGHAVLGVTTEEYGVWLVLCVGSEIRSEHAVELHAMTVTFTIALQAAEALASFHLQRTKQTLAKPRTYHQDMAQRCLDDIERIKRQLIDAGVTLEYQVTAMHNRDMAAAQAIIDKHGLPEWRAFEQGRQALVALAQDVADALRAVRGGMMPQ